MTDEELEKMGFYHVWWEQTYGLMDKPPSKSATDMGYLIKTDRLKAGVDGAKETIKQFENMMGSEDMSEWNDAIQNINIFLGEE